VDRSSVPHIVRLIDSQTGRLLDITCHAGIRDTGFVCLEWSGEMPPPSDPKNARAQARVKGVSLPDVGPMSFPQLNWIKKGLSGYEVSFKDKCLVEAAGK
jgi:hypothetical protein